MKALTLLLLCLHAFTTWAAPEIVGTQAIPMTPEHWSRADRLQFMDYLGEPAVMGYGGPYAAVDTDIADGRIDVDVAMHGQRGFIGLIFRDGGDGNFELVYLRPHKSGLPDAVQYTPSINRMSAWQLYSDGNFTAAAELPHSRWVHVAIEFVGNEARVYLDNRPEAALVVPELKGTTGKGAVGIWGGNVAHFANFTATTYHATPRRQPETTIAPGTLVDWELSNVVEAAALRDETIPSDLLWQSVEPETPGLINISRYHAKLPRSARTDPTRGLDVVFARTTLATDTPQRRKLWVGYSDEVVVYVNGDPVYEGRNSFGHRYPFSLGLLGMNQDAVWVDLQRGENEIVLRVGEVFGGWGFMLRGE